MRALLCLWMSCIVSLSAYAATDVTVKALFNGRALLEINGAQHLLKTGKTSPEGVVLVEATSKFATVKVDGRTHKLQLNRRIGGEYRKADKAVVRIASSQGGHYMTPGLINDRPVNFMVDTGATSVAMSLPTAQRLNIDYRNGQVIPISTAAGITRAYKITLQSVTVGGIKLHNVEAFVNESDFPQTILLGNSYLSRVDLKVDNGILVLQALY